MAAVLGETFAAQPAAIDRHALVTRHNVILTNADPLNPLTVGNGRFGFTADITGLQTFPAFHDAGIPLHTLSEWGWNTFPNPEHFTLEDALKPFQVHGRTVTYLDGRIDPEPGTQDRSKKAVDWLRANPHRIDLGRIGLALSHPDGRAAEITDLTHTSQTLDLWRGVLESRFVFDGQPVRVVTVCHPDRDALAVRIESPLVADGRLRVKIAFPYAGGEWRKAADWTKADRHQTHWTARRDRSNFKRVLDSETYHLTLAHSRNAVVRQIARHEFELSAGSTDELELVAEFGPRSLSGKPPAFARVQKDSSRHWKEYWSRGGAIDLSGSTDPRAHELERRIVLSQYLMAVNCAGDDPPQETGLVFDSWFGKFHLEMHWWHGAHFALWGREDLLERSLSWYDRIMPNARSTAQRQGYAGVRWPKMVGPDGRESPSTIGVFLIWQQPHPIYYAELMYRSNPTKKTLKRYQRTVFETAEFMASYAWLDEAANRYVLGPVLIPAQESYGSIKTRVINPTFELAYWHWALETAQQWRERLGMKRDPKWDDVIQRISKPTIRNGVYEAIEVEPFTIREDHPSMLAALGVLPLTPLIDSATMSRTLDAVWHDWDWPSTWGWDYPVMAMTAARVGRPDKAIDALFLPAQKNRYLANGHNYQDARLPVYLPGNGGLLTTVAMMAAGWDGSPTNAPGFPKDGSWNVRAEGLRKMP
ncbi:MAG TPA: hypothetical protein PKA41_09735 [Verrucomicrobiota bacterium]|nr:hypothetical protein [Verrucomicrobiota bacterium]